MTEQELRQALQRSLSDHMPAVCRQNVMNEITKKEWVFVKSKFKVALLLTLVLMLLSGLALAVSISREYFEDVAHIEFESGEYIDWELDEKLIMVDILAKHGFITEAEANNMDTEEEIDSFMLERYAFESDPDNMGAISLTRIAWVEMGPYTDWDNETWVWYTDMMFEIGLWSEYNDVDVYVMPGEEAISPQEAVSIAKMHLEEQGITASALNRAHVIWHYMTHASDVNREHLVYMITFRYEDQSEDYVVLTPDGQII